MKLGYGTVAFFNFQFYMIILCVLLVLITAPNFWLYNEFDGGNRKPVPWYSRLSISQIGFSKTLCKDTTLESGYLNLRCYAGEIKEIYTFGVIPGDAHILDACIPNEETE